MLKFPTIKQLSTRHRFGKVGRLTAIALLTFTLTLTGISPATAQFPFLPPLSAGGESGASSPLFNFLNQPYDCLNLQQCSKVWMKGNREPILIVASPPETAKDESLLPVDLRARKIQQKLNILENEVLARSGRSGEKKSPDDGAATSPPPPETESPKTSLPGQADALENTLEEAIVPTLESSQMAPFSMTVKVKNESDTRPLHPDTPNLGIALENGIPVVFLPPEKGFIKQTLLSVTKWDLMANHLLLNPIEAEGQARVQQIKNQLSDVQNLSPEQKDAFVLAEIWARKIERQLSRSLYDSEQISDNPFAFFKEIIEVITLTMIVLLGLAAFQYLIRRQKRKLGQELAAMEEAFAVNPESLSPEDIAEESEKKRAEKIKNMVETIDRKNAFSGPKKRPLRLISRLEYWWSSVAKISLKKQALTKQKLNILKLLDLIVLLLQLLVLSVGVGICLQIYPATRIYTNFLMSWPITIAGIWFFFSLTDKVVDFFIDYFLSRWATRAQKTSPTPQRYTLRVRTYSIALSQMTTVVFYSLAAIVSFSVIGLSTASLASAGVITLVTTYIFQPQIKNVIQGSLILLTDQYAVGDVVIIGGLSGFVEAMNLYMTRLRGEEGRLISIPNGSVEIVQNLTKEWSRVDFKVEIDYNADVKRALEIIEEVSEQMRHEPDWEDLILEPASILGVDRISNTGILIQVWIRTQPIQQWAVGRELRLRIKLAFDREGISIGIPQQRFYWSEGEPKPQNGNGGDVPALGTQEAGVGN